MLTFKKEVEAMYKGKRLLIIGASVHFIDVVKTCRELEIITIVIDYNPNAKAKKYADISLDIDTYDKDSVLKVAQEYDVEGVFVGWSDMNLYTAEYVCEKLGLPFYANQKQLENIFDKIKFKDLCRRYKVPIAKEYKLDEIEQNDFPLIVKPVDNGGSRGVLKCNNEQELLQNIDIAKSYSEKGNVIIEQFIDRQHINIYYTIIDSEIYLSTMCDKYIVRPLENMPPLPVALVHDSIVYDEYQKKVDPKIRDMFMGLGLKDGVLFVQAFTDGCEFYVYECGYRLNGGSTYFFMDCFNTYNQVKMLINYAFFGKMIMNPIDNVEKKFGGKGITLILSVWNGKIDQIYGGEVLDKYDEVIRHIQLYDVGDEIETSGGINQKQLFLFVFIVVETMDRFNDIAKDIVNNYSVRDVKGNEMLIDVYDVLENIKEGG